MMYNVMEMNQTFWPVVIDHGDKTIVCIPKMLRYTATRVRSKFYVALCYTTTYLINVYVTSTVPFVFLLESGKSTSLLYAHYSRS